MLCLLLPFWFLRGETASAATTPSYTVAFDYTHTYTYGSGAGTRKETSGDNNVYSAVVQSGSNTTATISVIMYGSGASGNAYLSNGGTIKSDTVNIQISGYNERRITVTDASGRTVGSGSSSVHLSGLSDGSYLVSVQFGFFAWTINSRAGASVTTTGSFSFTVAAEEHVHQYGKRVVAPTCTASGYTQYTCKTCGYSYTGDRTSALGHNYTSTTSGATCTSGGTVRYTCTRCGDSYT